MFKAGRKETELRPLVQNQSNNRDVVRAFEDEEKALSEGESTEGSLDFKGRCSEALNARWPCLPCCTWIRACCSLGLFMIIIAVLLVVAVLTVNAWAVKAIEYAGPKLMGVPVTVGSVNIALFNARSTIRNLQIESPPGLGANFLILNHGVLDLKLTSLWNKPLQLQVMELHDLEVTINQQLNGDSNAKRIIEHIDAVTTAGETAQQKISDDVHIMTTKIMVDKLSFYNIRTKLCIQPLCQAVPPGLIVVKQVQVANVGKKTGGVFVYELLEIIVQAILAAVIKSAPNGVNLQNALGAALPALSKLVDYEAIGIDVGSGLQTAADWTQWQLNRIGLGSQGLGGLAGQAIQEGGSEVANAIDGALGVTPGRPLTPEQQGMKNIVDGETHAISNVLAGMAKNSSSMIKEGINEAGANMSQTLGQLGGALGQMLQR
eukprot:TRINITY_DN30847_c0_g1_i1.p1 TRINITY_DN30847_c0_g1~~TRINITY_DN30847_c0_g1_i1.p1  ORF type:complete len:433 (-),score=75.62 TRINITY_DN30847_c0_g1_i1:145-1443(-)